MIGQTSWPKRLASLALLSCPVSGTPGRQLFALSPGCGISYEVSGWASHTEAMTRASRTRPGKERRACEEPRAAILLERGQTQPETTGTRSEGRAFGAEGSVSSGQAAGSYKCSLDPSMAASFLIEQPASYGVPKCAQQTWF